ASSATDDDRAHRGGRRRAGALGGRDMPRTRRFGGGRRRAANALPELRSGTGARGRRGSLGDAPRRGRAAGRHRSVVPPRDRCGALLALALAVCRHLDGLVFDLPSLGPEEAVLPLLAVRAALGLRPAVGVLRTDTTPEQVRLFAALALACDADVMLASSASAE